MTIADLCESGDGKPAVATVWTRKDDAFRTCADCAPIWKDPGAEIHFDTEMMGGTG